MIQSSGPLRYATVEGMDARDIRVHNYPPGWNAAPSQDLLVIRRNHKLAPYHSTRRRWGIFPYWSADPEHGAPRSLTPLYPFRVNLPMSAWGHSRPMHLVPVPINVRCYSNSNPIVRRSEVTLRAMYGRCPRCKRNLTFLRSVRVQPCMRPVFRAEACPVAMQPLWLLALM